MADPESGTFSSIFGGNTGLTYDALKNRRAIAAALAARRMKLPTTIGEGMTYFGESLNEALGNYRLNQAEQAYAAKQAALQKGLEADPEAMAPPLASGGATPSPAPPAPAGPMVSANASLDTSAGDPGAVAPGSDPGTTVFDRPPPPGAMPGSVVMADGAEGQPLPPNPPIVTDIKPRPIEPTFPPVNTAPPPSLGRTPLPADANTIPEITAPVMPPMGPRERKAFSVMNSTDDPNTKAVAKAVMDQERQRRLDAHERNVKEFDAKVQLRNAMKLQQQKATIDQPETEGRLREQEMKLRSQAEADLLKGRFGGRDPEKFFAEMDKDKAIIQTNNNALKQAALARSAIAAGVVTGFGANQRLDAERLQAWALKNGLSGNVASNTELMNAALKSMLNIAIQNIQGGDTRVTDADIKVASGTIGADPTLQLETIKKLITNNERVAREKLNDFEDRRDYYLKGTRAERNYHVPTEPTAPPQFIDNLLKNRDSETDRHEFNKRYGAGAAELEIARAKRRER